MDDSKQLLDMKAVLLGFVEAHVGLASSLCEILGVETDGIEYVLGQVMTAQAQAGGGDDFVAARQRPARMIRDSLCRMRQLNGLAAQSAHTKPVPGSRFKVYPGGLAEALGDGGLGGEDLVVSEPESSRHNTESSGAEND